MTPPFHVVRPPQSVNYPIEPLLYHNPPSAYEVVHVIPMVLGLVVLHVAPILVRLEVTPIMAPIVPLVLVVELVVPDLPDGELVTLSPTYSIPSIPSIISFVISPSFSIPSTLCLLYWW